MEDMERALNDFLNDPDNADRLRLRQEVRRAMNDRGGVFVPYKKGRGVH